MYKNHRGLFVENTADIYRYLTINETYFKTLTIEHRKDENKTMITYNLWIRTTMQCRHTHSKLSFPAPISKCSFTIPKSILV